VVADLSCGGGGGGRAVRAALLEDVLRTLGLATAAPVVGVPAATDLAVRGYPNPFNPRVRIEYVMPRPGQMNMVVHNVRGERVRVLRDEKVPAGPGHVIWDGTDSTGAPAASGVYFCRTVAAGKEVVQKLMLVR
jgi:hypothetical protein